MGAFRFRASGVVRRNANADEHYEIAIPPSLLVANERPRRGA
jgi:hypothetical protein